MVSKGFPSKEGRVGTCCLMGIKFSFCKKSPGNWLQNKMNVLNTVGQYT